MATRWSITFDCHDAPTLAEFWKVALGYVAASPPTGWETWEDWARHFEVPEEEWDDGASLVDPDRARPPVSFLKVPEGKTAKNRLHLDVRIGGADRIPAEVERLVGLGATVLGERGGDAEGLVWWTLADPEGNEVDLATWVGRD